MRNASVEDVKAQYFFIDFKEAIKYITQGELLFESNILSVKLFSKYISES